MRGAGGSCAREAHSVISLTLSLGAAYGPRSELSFPTRAWVRAPTTQGCCEDGGSLRTSQEWALVVIARVPGPQPQKLRPGGERRHGVCHTGKESEAFLLACLTPRSFFCLFNF